MLVKSALHNYQVIDYIGPEKMEMIRPVWEAWQQHPNADYEHFLTVASSRPSVICPLAITVYSNNAPCALAACRIEKVELPVTIGYVRLGVFGIRQLTVVYGGLMGTWNDYMASAFIGHLRKKMRQMHIDAVYLSAMSNDNHIYKMVNRQVPFFLRCNAHKDNLHWTASVPLSYREFLSRINKKHQKQLRNKERKLTDHGGGSLHVRLFQMATDVEELCSIAETIARITYHRGIGVGFHYNNETVKRLRVLAEKGWMRGFVLYANNRCCAFWLGTLYNRVFHLEYTGFDPEFRVYDPGQVLFNKMIEDLCGSGTVDSIDFGFGDALYKRQYGDCHFPESDMLLFNATPSMVLANAVQNAAAWINDRTEKTLKMVNLYDRIKKSSRRSAERSIVKI